MPQWYNRVRGPSAYTEQEASSVLLIQSGLRWTYADRRQVPGWSAILRFKRTSGLKQGKLKNAQRAMEVPLSKKASVYE